MRVETDAGAVIELGTTEATPTIGITDYSRRVTDDFGVTTVVPRSFSRTMSLRLCLPTDEVDGLQRRLAELRASAATWIADDRYAWLSAKGYYKDFEVTLATETVSFCTLTVEGLAETGTVADTGGDPAPAGTTSTLRLLDPLPVTDAVLTGSSVAETDAPEWSATATYALGARVMKAATHRIYESAAGANVGEDPAAGLGKWIDVGPTNRWAAFDEALGSATTGDGQIVMTLTPSAAVGGLAVLDTDGGSIRVQAPGYDRTQLRGAGEPDTALFLDLAVAAGANITVTIGSGSGVATARCWDDASTWQDSGTWQDTALTATSASTGRNWNDSAAWVDAGMWVDAEAAPGTGPVSVGTLMIGRVVPLGITEASPTAGITDYSKKDVDDFGAVTVVERAWAKRMSAKALIRTDALDLVANRLAAVRARPALWIGDAGHDSLTVYGFFKDFSIEVGEAVSTVALSIEGLSKAAPVGPLKAGTVDWPDVADPSGTKPADNATNSADPTSPFGPGKTVADALDRFDTLETEIIPAVDKAVQDAQDAIAAAKVAAADGVAAANARLDLARADLDQAVGDLAAEIARAQGADEQLSHRIDALVASGGDSDSSVRAMVTAEQTARADADRAIGQRIDTVETAYKAADTSTNARVTDEATARSDADGALGVRIDAVVTAYKAADATVDARITSEATARTNADAAIGQRIDTVETDYKGRDTATNARITAQVTALTDADHALGQRIDAVVASGGYDDTAVRSEITRVETASVDRDTALGHRIDTIAANGGYDDTAVKASIQQVSTASVDRDSALGSRIDTVTSDYKGRDTATNARITQEVSTLATADQAASTRSAAIEASVGTVSGRVGTVETAVSDGRFAAALRVQTLESDYGNTKATVTQQAGTIADLGQKTAAYVRYKVDAGNGVAELDLWSDQYGGSWRLTGTGEIGGNTRFTGDLQVVRTQGGGRVEITSAGVKVYDGNNVLRVALGAF